MVTQAEEPGFLKFHINSQHSIYEVEGLVPLQKLLHEIEVIERIRRSEDGSGFVDGAVDSVKATGNGLVRLAVHPVQSVKGVGKAIGKLGGKVAGIFDDKEKGEKTTFSEKVLGRAERQLADKFGVDVYTTNPYLKELLSRMAKARLAGKGTVTAINFMIPTTGLIQATATVSGINAAADQTIRDNGRADLFQMNQDSLMALGFTLEETNRLLNLLFYSPREATYLRFYLESVKDIDGFREIFKTASEAKSLWEARKILYESQMLADAVKKNHSFKKIRCLPEGLAAEEDSRMIFFTPYDYLDLSEPGGKVLERIHELTRARTFKNIEIWNGGKVTGRFIAACLAKGIRVTSWHLFLV